MYDYSRLKIKVDDPLIAKWALHILGRLQETSETDCESFGESVFNELALHRLIDQADPEVLPSLFRLLPARSFSPLTDSIVNKWPSWESVTASWSAKVIAQLEPGLAVGLFEEFVSSKNCFRDANKTYGVIESLAEMAPGQGAKIRERLLDAYLGLRASFVIKMFFPEMFNLAYQHNCQEAFKLLQKLPAVADKDYRFDSLLQSIYRKVAGGLPYFRLARDIIEEETHLSFAGISRLFMDNAPLGEMDKLCRSGKTSAMHKALELFPSRQNPEEPVTVELAGKLLEVEGKLPDREQKECLAGLIIALLAYEYAVSEPGWSTCGLAELVDYAASDISLLPGYDDMVKRLMELDRDEVTEKLVDRYPEEWETYGGVTMADIMGDLGYPEFAPVLLKSLDEDGDYLCEAAMYALGKIGEAAEMEICEHWDSLSKSQQIFSFGALEHCGGERTVKLLMDIFPEMKGHDIEQWCMTALSVPDPRLIEVLEPELRREQHIIDETFLTLCSLLDYDYPCLQEVKARWMENEEQRRAKREAFDKGPIEDWMTESINLELSCPLCGESNTYGVDTLFVGMESEDHCPFIGQELCCLSCGQLAELKMTAKGHLAVTAELMKAMAVKEMGREYEGPIEFADARLADGRVVSLGESISHYKNRIEKKPDSVVDLISLGNCYRKVNHPTRAREIFKKAIETNPAYVEASLGLAYLLKEDSRYLEAFEVLDRTLEHRKQWKFCRLRSITEQQFHHAFADLYNDLRSFLKIKDKPALHYTFAETPTKKSRKIGRNEPCPCGSGKKYKKCCLGKED